MKKLFTICIALMAITFANAQASFSDDFESYNLGTQGVALQSTVWSTWSGDVAGEDAPLSTDFAHSGTKSVKLITTSTTGGPTDLVCKFTGAPYTSGTFVNEMWVYVVPGKGGYYNYQANTTIGQVWSLNVYFANDGQIYITGSGNTILLEAGPYSQGEWFKFKMDVNLTINDWKAYVNDIPRGSFFNPDNKISSIDIFPVGLPAADLSTFYIDDFSYSYTPAVLQPKDGAMYQVTSKGFGIAGQTIPVSGAIRNVGTTAITSYDVELFNGTDTYVKSVTGVNVASLATNNFTFDAPYTIIGGNQNITLSITNVNGSPDDDLTNDGKNKDIRGYVPAPGKNVVVEEATGTWCPWCVRGTVFMDYMSDTYPGYFIGIAVHNGDPMTLTEYDASLTSFPGFTGFPSVVVNREDLMDPSEMEVPVLEKLEEPSPVVLSHSSTYDAATGDLNVTVEGNFLQNLTGEYKLNLVIVEDGLHGTDATWAQANAYAGGSNGVMGGYETKPNPVPAAQMIYDHVGIALPGSFAGVAGSLPATIGAGESHAHTFTYNISNSVYDNIKLVGMVIGPDGQIITALETTIEESLAAPVALNVNQVRVLPNPADQYTWINLELVENANTSVRIFDNIGRLVSTQDFGQLSGSQALNINTANLANGMYNFQIIVGKETTTRKVVIAH